jgi:hypothetical protein
MLSQTQQLLTGLIDPMGLVLAARLLDGPQDETAEVTDCTWCSGMERSLGVVTAWGKLLTMT